MRNSTRNSLLLLGTAWIAGWIFLWLLGIIGVIYLFWGIPGILLIWIALYNWGDGPDLYHKQETPIENEVIDDNSLRLLEIDI